MYFIMKEYNDGTFRIGDTLDMSERDWTDEEIAHLHSTGPKRVWGYAGKGRKCQEFHDVDDPDSVRKAAEGLVRYFNMRLKMTYPQAPAMHVKLIAYPQEQGHFLIALCGAAFSNLIRYCQKDGSELTQEMRVQLSQARRSAADRDELVKAMDGNLAFELCVPDMCDALDADSFLPD